MPCLFGSRTLITWIHRGRNKKLGPWAIWEPYGTHMELGHMGHMGHMGPMGPMGPMGAMGFMGFMGSMGPMGPMGSMGPHGPPWAPMGPHGPRADGRAGGAGERTGGWVGGRTGRRATDNRQLCPTGEGADNPMKHDLE